MGINIDGMNINENSDCFIIAEIGHNHQGNMDKAKALFLQAKDCGVNAVKLQKRDNKTLYTRAMYESPYDNENSFGPTYGMHREVLEFGREEYIELKRYAKELGLVMFATAFDFPSADFLAELDMPAYKVASGDLTNTPLLKYIAKLGKPMLVSTGGATIADVQRAYNTIMPINPQLCLMQCTASYPCEPEEMNLRVIETYQRLFPGAVIGLSDHQNGISAALIAYLLGARIIEKHFTLNRAWKGTDHAFSLEPGGMHRLVRDLHRASLMLGDGEKRAYPSEIKPLTKMRKKLVASKDLPAGHILTYEDLSMKSPGDGLLCYELENVIGCVLTKMINQDDAISPEILEKK